MLFIPASGFHASPAALAAPPAVTAVLDGLSPTSAYSFSRNLLSSFAGSRYADTSGAITTLTNQEGTSARNLTDGGTSTRRPALTTAGPNSLACGDFDGSTDYLATSAASSNFVANNSGFVIATVIFDTITLNNANPWQNHTVWGDAGANLGLHGKNSATKSAIAYNFVAATTQDSQGTLVAAQAHVLTWRHESGTLYVGVDGVESAGVTSGNTTAGYSGQVMQVARSNAINFDGKLFELATFSTVPLLAERTAMINDFKAHVGI